MEDQDISDAAIIGASYLARGFVSFPEWSQQMLSDLGERFRPSLPFIFERSKVYYEAVEMDQLDSAGRDGDSHRQNILNARAELNSAISDWHEFLRRPNLITEGKDHSEPSLLISRSAEDQIPKSLPPTLKRLMPPMPIYIRVAFTIARCIAAGFALYATARHPYSFYILTRWIVFLTCCWGVFLTRQQLWPSFAPVYAVLGLLFNPLFPFHFARDTWHNLDIAAAIILLISLPSDCRNSPRRMRSPQHGIEKGSGSGL